MREFADVRLGADVLERTVVPGLDDVRGDGDLSVGDVRYGDLRALSDV